MKSFLKQNAVLAAGICLPMIVMLFFWLAASLPKQFVAPPRYGLLFSAGDGEHGNSHLAFRVENGILKAYLTCLNPCRANDGAIGWYARNSGPMLYIFDAASQTAKKIPVQFPKIPPGAVRLVTNIKIPELKNMTLDTAAQAPDGYQYYSGEDNDGLFFWLFSDNARWSVIRKNNYSIPISPGNNNNVQFIGWIIPDKERPHAH